MMNPKHPVYVISKGRWESRLTSRALERMGVPYSIVVEPQEYDLYSSVIDRGKILALPFGNLGQGSIPARNWVWDHSVGTGAERHWILDDNISCFYWKGGNNYHKVLTGITFRIAEDFTERYENVALSGMNYEMFALKKQVMPPYYLNTRIYSCILIRNNLPYRWSGRYNEDTDLSLRVLKDGWCTVLFNAFLCDKTPTMKMRGGNTDELYKDDGRLKMAESLVDQHPDVTKVGWRWGRYQHIVDYTFFKKPWRNRLRRKPGIVIPESVDNYGMKIVFPEDKKYWRDRNFV